MNLLLDTLHVFRILLVEKLKTPSVIPHTQGNLALFAGAATVTPL
jgi:hypothetical protein